MNKYIFVLGLTFLLASHIVMLHTFIYAMLQDASVTIYINRYNEMWAEFVMLIISIPCIIYTMKHIIKKNKLI